MDALQERSIENVVEVFPCIFYIQVFPPSALEIVPNTCNISPVSPVCTISVVVSRMIQLSFAMYTHNTVTGFCK